MAEQEAPEPSNSLPNTPPNSPQKGPLSRQAESDQSSWSRAGQALLIPSLMGAGPLAGLLVGWLIRRWTGWGGWVIVVFMILGVVAGIRETVKIIRKL